MPRRYLFQVFLITFVFVTLFSGTGVVLALISPHGGYTVSTDWCAVCHRGHTALLQSLRVRTPEESVCLICHDGTGSSYNIQSEFAKTYKHPVVDYVGRHASGTSDNVSLANRHAECEDCHDPHKVSGPAHTLGSNLASNKLAGAWGQALTMERHQGHLPVIPWLTR